MKGSDGQGHACSENSGTGFALLPVRCGPEAPGSCRRPAHSGGPRNLRNVLVSDPLSPGGAWGCRGRLSLNYK